MNIMLNVRDVDSEDLREVALLEAPAVPWPGAVLVLNDGGTGQGTRWLVTGLRWYFWPPILDRRGALRVVDVLAECIDDDEAAP